MENIAGKYIEGDPTADINTIPLDDILYIKGSHTESNSPNLRPLLQIVVINVEPQKAANPGYPTNKNIARITRAFFNSKFLNRIEVVKSRRL